MKLAVMSSGGGKRRRRRVQPAPVKKKTVWDKIQEAGNAMGPTELLVAVANMVPHHTELRRVVATANLGKIRTEMQKLGAGLTNDDARAMAELLELYATWHGRYAPKPDGRKRRREATLKNLPHELLAEYILPHLNAHNMVALTRAGAYIPIAQELQMLVQLAEAYEAYTRGPGTNSSVAQHVQHVARTARQAGFRATHLRGYRFRVKSPRFVATLDFDVGESFGIRTPDGRKIARVTRDYGSGADWRVVAYAGVDHLTADDVLRVIVAALEAPATSG